MLWQPQPQHHWSKNPEMERAGIPPTHPNITKIFQLCYLFAPTQHSLNFPKDKVCPIPNTAQGWKYEREKSQWLLLGLSEGRPLPRLCQVPFKLFFPPGSLTKEVTPPSMACSTSALLPPASSPDCPRAQPQPCHGMRDTR